MTQPKKLIEVAMPIKEISAESVRDKSIRHGHISTLHLWWARRPLPVCRAVVFASLVPDPEDKNCPQAFKNAVKLLLGKENNPGDPYKPYDDIPYTTAIDKMEDNLRNRLMMFIGKFSEKYIQATKQDKAAAAKDMLSDASLIKWDNKNDDKIIGKARKLIWVAHNAFHGRSAEELLEDFDKYYKAIKEAEIELYNLQDRHVETENSKLLNEKLKMSIDAFQEKMPKVFDPFAGGGAIPLEASRLGCKTYGNDINPVAHIIQKGSLEFPQKYGKPINYSNSEFFKLYGEEAFKDISNDWKTYSLGNATGVRIPNRLSFDVEFFAKKLFNETEKEIGYLYPADENGNKPMAYYWARVGKCSNPSCKAEVPLLKQFYLSKRRGAKKEQWVYLKPNFIGININFEIGIGEYEVEGWNERGNLKCPCCGNISSAKQLKEIFKKEGIQERLLAVIEEGSQGKIFRIPREDEIEILNNIEINNDRPADKMQVKNNRNFNTPGWGIDSFGQMFSDRQIYVLSRLISNLKKMPNDIGGDFEYRKAIITYLAILVDRIIARYNTFCRWHILQDTIEHPFSRQAIPMIFDFPELNIFADHTNGALGNLKQILNYLIDESNSAFITDLANAASGTKEQFPEKYLTATITDPPYYDAIAYADLSDFFYVWLQRTLSEFYPLNFATPYTPKTEECTALKHHHGDNLFLANTHFEKTLKQIFDTLEHQTSDIVSIMFAHQSTAAWTTLCNSILGARMNITGSWAIDTEMATRALSISSAALSSSVTVSCKPSQRNGIGEFKFIKKAIELAVSKEVKALYALGFRGADLLTACFGKAVSEFGIYEKVEKADGSEVTVAELLEMARESAFNALLKGFDGDDFTKFYIAWLQLYGFVESDFDDAAKFSRVGLSINVQELFTDHILIKKLNKQALGGYSERLAASKNLGDKANSHLIDQVHRAMYLYKGSNRGILLEYMHRVASNPDSSFWRVLTSLCEILPGGGDDHKQASGLITNKESLIRESQAVQRDKAPQTNLFE